MVKFSKEQICRLLKSRKLRRIAESRRECVETFRTKNDMRLGYRWGPLYCVVEEEVESSHLKFLASPPGNVVTSCPYSTRSQSLHVDYLFEFVFAQENLQKLCTDLTAIFRTVVYFMLSLKT